MAAFAALALVPDLDLLAPYVGVQAKGTPLEHRVMTHSLTFAVIVGTLLTLAVQRRLERSPTLSAIGALASHGVLDALTDNHPAPALLWPLSDRPIQFIWTPIPGTRSFQEYFEIGVLPIVSEEALWSLPIVLATYLIVSGSRERDWSS